jgi:ABC-type sugar transport system ATPase subunit
MDVRVEGLQFFRGRRPVLAIPELTFADGRTTALLGRNGSGKTTLLRLIAALERPRAGQVLIGGQPAAPSRVRETVALAFQQPVFLSSSVRANLDLALRLRNLDARERARRIEEAARACGVEHLLERTAIRLSGGESRRVNLARALCLRAPVTLLDEPMAGLDGPARGQLLHELPGLLRDFATTTILVTHDRDEALRLADDLVILLDGQVRASGPRQEVFRRPPDPETAELLGYTLIQSEGGRLAVAPGALRPGPGEVNFLLQVDAYVDLGSQAEAFGTVGGASLAVRLPPGTPTPGATLAVSAPADAVISFIRTENNCTENR